MNINESVYNKQEVSIVDVKSSNIEEAFLRGRGYKVRKGNDHY